MIRSCLDRHPPERLHFHFLDVVGLPREEHDRLAAMVRDAGGELSVHVIDPDRLAAFPPCEEFGGHVVWARLLLPELLSSFERVLYLDADTFVVDSLEPLWSTPLDGAPFGAVANVVEPAMWSHLAALGIEDPRDILNSGVLLLDLNTLRLEDALSQITRFVADHANRLTWADQDALNCVFDRRWCHLHPRWNAQNSFWTWREWAAEVFGDEQLEQAVHEPAIIHFEGPHVCKPWHYLCRHPARHAYRTTRARTPWGPIRFEDRTLATRIIGRMPARHQVDSYIRLLRLRRGLERARRGREV